MRIQTKMRGTLYTLAAVVLVIAILLGITSWRHSTALDSHYANYVGREAYRQLIVRDATGVEIFSKGSFSEDKTTREATFHLIGDKNLSVPTSVLTSYVNNVKNGILTGYQIKENQIDLTIDLRMQLGAYQILRDAGQNGTIIVADYKTGEIKTMVSTPAVDVYDTENVNDGAFLNKAVYAYTPGSVFKSVSVAAIMQKAPTAATAFEFNCTGSYEHLSCQKAHGNVTLKTALYKSCNCAIGAAVSTYLTATELDDFAQKSGLLSEDIVADFKIKTGNVEAADDFMWAASGQSKNMITPLSVLAHYAAIANEGVRLLLKINKATSVDYMAERIFEKETANFLLDSLTTGMREWYGSPIYANSFGKTGTAQLDGNNAHAWFACAITDDNAPQYAVVTMLEHGDDSALARRITANFVNRYVLGGG